jgi:hypothetical protein
MTRYDPFGGVWLSMARPRRATRLSSARQLPTLTIVMTVKSWVDPKAVLEKSTSVRYGAKKKHCRRNRGRGCEWNLLRRYRGTTPAECSNSERRAPAGGRTAEVEAHQHPI